MKEHIDMATVQADFDRIALLSKQDADEGWNHNNHYHRFLLGQVPACCADALDIGCGTGQFARLRVVLVEDDILQVCVADARELLDNCERIHVHPEEMARVDVRRDVRADSRELRERLDVVDERPRMQLDAEHQLGMLPPCELRDLGPVRTAGLVPLPLVLSLEVREPAAGGEAWTDVARAGALRPPASRTPAPSP